MIYGRCGQVVTILRMAVLADVKNLDNRRADKHDRERIKLGMYLVVKDGDSERLYDYVYLRADGACHEIDAAILKAKADQAQSDLYNPRYVAYATANGRTPEAQLAHDKVAYPGGCMAGFIIWISEQQRTVNAAKINAAKVHGETTQAVIDGLRAGGKLSKLETGSHDYRMDFRNGDYWFLAQTVVKELIAAGFIKADPKK